MEEGESASNLVRERNVRQDGQKNFLSKIYCEVLLLSMPDTLDSRKETIRITKFLDTGL